MKIRFLPILILTVAMSTGCTSTFTSMEKQADNSYYLTQVKQGPYFVAGSAWSCTPKSETIMKCTRVAVP